MTNCVYGHHPKLTWCLYSNVAFNYLHYGQKKYLGGAQHKHAHWTRVELPEGHHDIASLEHIPGVLPFEVYAQAPLRLISWCSFELDSHSRTLLRDLAIMCENPDTSMNQLVSRIAQMHPSVRTEQDAIHYLATLATVRIAAKAQMPNYTTMAQHFLRTLQLPMAIYMLYYYLPMLNPNDGYNETGLTLQSAGPVLDEWQAIHSSLTCSRAVNLATGKRVEVKMPLPFDTPALNKRQCGSSLKVKLIITKLVQLARVDSLH